MVNGKKVLYARAPIALRFSEFNSDPKDASAPPDFQVYLCINLNEFANGVLNLRIIQGGTLLAVIGFAIAMVIVVFITYG
jgi:hypothetical protein